MFLQAVRNHLYNDHAALYYLLLSKWEKGKLSMPYTNPLTPHQQLSLCGVPPSMPHISVHGSSDAKPLGGMVVPQGPLEGGLQEVSLEEGGSDELIKDPNLDRYLKHGRRHTLGAAHNTMLLNPDEMRRSATTVTTTTTTTTTITLLKTDITSPFDCPDLEGCLLKRHLNCIHSIEDPLPYVITKQCS